VQGTLSLKTAIAVAIFLRLTNTSLLPEEFRRLINPQHVVEWKYVNRTL
jgi:hypothetical protein